MFDGSRSLWGHAAVLQASDQEQERRRAVCWTLVCKSILFILIIYPTFFCPTLPLHPAPKTGGIPMLPATLLQQPIRAHLQKEGNQTKKSRKKVSFQLVFLLNSNKYMEMQWFLLILSSNVFRLLLIDLWWIFSSNPDRLSW